MGVIEDEIENLKRNCERVVPDSKLVTCVPSQIRVEIRKSDYKKVVVCCTYPFNYPKHPILIELKSKTISEKLLDGLVRVSEQEARKHLGKPQCLIILKFIRNFIENNPLCSVSEEISEVKNILDLSESGRDKLKLNQKTSSVLLKIFKNGYFFQTDLKVSDDYPAKQVSLENVECNFPRVFKVWLTEQAKEISRKCVQPPLRPPKNAGPFVIRPSLKEVSKFLVNFVKRYPDEICQACRQKCFPENPADVVHDEHGAAHVERVYCSHCFHHDCLILYMKSPPFEGIKKCQSCRQTIYHEKWKVTPKLAEARWAHEQARNRELGEVVEFFQDI